MCEFNVAATSRPPGDGEGSEGAFGVGTRRGANHCDRRVTEKAPREPSESGPGEERITVVVRRERNAAGRSRGAVAQKQNGPSCVGWPVCEFNVAATYFPTSVRGSIIGPPELNGRVRDGNGCDLRGIATTKS